MIAGCEFACDWVWVCLY